MKRSSLLTVVGILLCLPVCGAHADDIADRIAAQLKATHSPTDQPRPHPTAASGYVRIVPAPSDPVTVHLKEVYIMGLGMTPIPADGSTVRVPAGMYDNVTGIARARDRRGVDWELVCVDATGFRVTAGKVSALQFRGPLVPSLAPHTISASLRRKQDTNPEPKLSFRRGTKVTLEPKLRLHGDNLTAVFIKTGGRGQMPSMDLKDRSGRVVSHARNGKAGIPALTYSLNVPASLKPGRYTLGFVWDLGPFGGVLKASREVVVRCVSEP